MARPTVRIESGHQRSLNVQLDLEARGFQQFPTDWRAKRFGFGFLVVVSHSGLKGLCTDSSGNVYVASKSSDAVLVFDQNGNQVTSISKRDPIGVAIANNLLIVTGGVSQKTEVGFL